MKKQQKLPMDNKFLGQRLKELRSRLGEGMSQKQFAEMLNEEIGGAAFKNVVISSLELGKRDFTGVIYTERAHWEAYNNGETDTNPDDNPCELEGSNTLTDHLPMYLRETILNIIDEVAEGVGWRKTMQHICYTRIRR